ncbi:MAG: hypothetical protein V7741_00735 [Hyphomonas sp.]
MRQLLVFSAALFALVMGGQAAWADPPELEVSPDVYKALKFMELRSRVRAPGETELKVLRNKILQDNIVSEDEQRVIDQFRSDTANFTYRSTGSGGAPMSSTLNVTLSPETAAFLDTIVSDKSITDLELLWRKNDEDAWSSIVGISTQSEAEKSRAEAFMAEKFYAAWLKQEKSDEPWSRSGPFDMALTSVRSRIFQLSGDEWKQGKALFKQSVLMAVKMANDDGDQSAIPPFRYHDLIEDEPMYSDDEEDAYFEDGNR